MECRHCVAEPVIFLRYAGRSLCRRHFLAWVERTARREFRRQLRAVGPALRAKASLRLGVALSGGKDSTVALHLVTAWARQQRNTVVALAVDEGLPGYRPPALACASETCRELGVELRTLAFTDLVGRGLWELEGAGSSAPAEEVAGTLAAEEAVGAAANSADKRGAPRAAGPSPCSPCGLLRRRALNRLAREAGVDLLVLGHNLDDCAQTVLMNHARGDVARIQRMAPHAYRQPGLVPRLLPLRRLPEREVYLYALLRNLAFHDGICPFAGRAQRNLFREVLLQLESHTPGTRHALLRGMDRLREALGPSQPLATCPSCGEPAGGVTGEGGAAESACRFCQLFGEAAGEARPRRTD